VSIQNNDSAFCNRLATVSYNVGVPHGDQEDEDGWSYYSSGLFRLEEVEVSNGD
jgi:hypothetical protein